MGRIECYLLGGFELRIDGSPIEIQPAGRRLLALLALTDRLLAREFVAFQLWPDSLEQRALANLRSALWRLGDLTRDVLEVTPTRLALSSDVWLDVRHGIRALADGNQEMEALVPFSVHRFELLPDWYDDWLVVERESFRQLALRLLTSRAAAALDGGDTADAIQLALGALSVEPHHEGAHEVLTAAHFAEGNTFEAMRERARFDALAHA